MVGRLVLGGAPLGQPGDVGPRLREVMATADVLAVEDTRRLHRLASDLGVTFTGRVVTFHESVEKARLPGLMAALADGATVLLLTDAGMPSVSDPGYTLVRAAIDAGVPVTSVPGPSAVTTALAVSGLPVDRFCFEGFLPRKGGERRSLLAGLADERRTMVFFESPHRLADALADAAARVRSLAGGRGLPRADQDLRGDPPRSAGGAGGVGGRGREGRDHAGGGAGRSRRRWISTPPRWPPRSRRRRPRVPPARTRSAPSSSAPVCPGGPSTTPSSPPSRPTLP